MKLKNIELISIVGGATQISGTLLNSISKLIITLLDVGRAIGSAIRYKVSGYTCKK